MQPSPELSIAQMDWLVTENIDSRYGKQRKQLKGHGYRRKLEPNCNQESLFYSLDDILGIDQYYKPEWTDEDILAIQEGFLIDNIKQAYQYKNFRRCSLFVEAMEWIMSEEKYGFSFNQCCAAIPVDPDEFREAMLLLISKDSKELLDEIG